MKLFCAVSKQLYCAKFPVVVDIFSTFKVSVLSENKDEKGYRSNMVLGN